MFFAHNAGELETNSKKRTWVFVTQLSGACADPHVFQNHRTTSVVENHCFTESKPTHRMSNKEKCASAAFLLILEIWFLKIFVDEVLYYIRARTVKCILQWTSQWIFICVRSGAATTRSAGLCLIPSWNLSALNSSWHLVGAQEIFVEGGGVLLFLAGSPGWLSEPFLPGLCPLGHCTAWFRLRRVPEPWRQVWGPPGLGLEWFSSLLWDLTGPWLGVWG